MLTLPGCFWLARPGGAGIERFPDRTPYRTDGVDLVIEYTSADAGTVAHLEKALSTAIPRIHAWGSFTTPVTIRVYPTHADLEIAVHRYHYPWLRAWARYDEIFLQSPRSFGLFEGGADNLAELLTHELTHCLMYQLAADASDWRQKDFQIPIWFREGMASWTAQQGHRRMSEARLADWIRTTHENPVTDAPSLYQHESEAVYGAAHWAFAFLVERYGAPAIRRLLAAMKLGASFDTAFQHAIGLERHAFESEFLRYLAWDGWEDRRHPPPARLLTSASASPTAAAAPADAPRRAASAAAPPR